MRANNIVTAPGFNVSRLDPGPLVQTTPAGGFDARYGIGQFANRATRVYAGTSNVNASVSLSLAKSTGGFEDVLKVTTDETTRTSGPLAVNAVISSSSGYKVTSADLGPMIEMRLQDNDRFGIGQFPGGTFRAYTGTSYSLSSLNLSLVDASNTYNDVLRITTDGKMQINNALTVGNTLTATSFKGDGSQLTNVPSVSFSIPNRLLYTNHKMPVSPGGGHVERRMTFATPMPHANYHVQITPHQNVLEIDNGPMKPICAYLRRKFPTYFDFVVYAPDGINSLATNNVYVDILITYD